MKNTEKFELSKGKNPSNWEAQLATRKEDAAKILGEFS